VIGIGEQKTPKPFISACDRFIYIEFLNGHIKKQVKVSHSETDTKKVVEKVNSKLEKLLVKSPVKIDDETLDLIESTIDDLADDDGWAFLGDVGNLIVRKKPDFDPRNYGFTKLTPFLKSLSDFVEIDERELDGKRIKHVYVRLK
jgi:Fe-S-cluster formation regulator IscX/YfhJ